MAHLVDWLLAAGHRVRILDDLSTGRATICRRQPAFASARSSTGPGRRGDAGCRWPLPLGGSCFVGPLGRASLWHQADRRIFDTAAAAMISIVSGPCAISFV